MKFLCPSCKAKYQIADEKIIGRSVKMKCRQCGHVIEIQEAVVGASTSSSLPPVPARGAVPHASDSTDKSSEGEQKHPEPSAAHLRQLAKSTHATGTTPGAPRTIATTLAGEVGVPRAPAHKPLSSLGSRTDASKAKPLSSSGVTRPLTTASAKVPPQTAEKSHGAIGALVSRAAPRHSPQSPVATAHAAPSSGTSDSEVSNVQAEPLPNFAAARGTTASQFGAPAGTNNARKAGEALVEAFTSAVGENSNLAGDQLVGDEWYVGINDTPVGPIPLSELRARATQGQVTVDSLVWRDGFEDWKPLRSFPELMAVVEEAISSVHASRMPFAAVASLEARELQSLASSGIAAVTNSSIGGTEAVVATQNQSPIYVPVATPQITAEEFAAATGLGPRRAPRGAWVAVAGALALGLAIGFVFFKQAPAAPEIKYVEVARSAAPTQSGGPSAPAAASQEAPVVAPVEEIKGMPRKSSNSGEPKAADGANGAALSNGLKGLSGLRALGPQSGPSQTGATPGASGGQTLDSATLQKNVARYTPSVKRSCWQPALDSRTPDAPTTARVSVKIDIAPSGNVSNVSSSGDPRGYRGLASCIESRVRNWTFPPSSGATTVNVPFVFAAQ